MRPILIAEDNDDDFELLMMAMETARIDSPVVRVRDGHEALDYLRKEGAFASRADHHPEFMMLDLKMPRMDGFDVLRAVRQSDLLRNIPVVAFTSSAQERDVALAYDLGISGYVVKPVSFTDLIDAVKLIGGVWAQHNGNTACVPWGLLSTSPVAGRHSVCACRDPLR